MKHFSLLLAVITITFAIANAGTTHVNEEKYKYEGTVNIEGATTQDIMRRAKKWFATGMDSEHRILDKFETTADKVVIKGTGGIKFTGKENPFKKGYVKYNVVIVIMDGMYTYVIHKFDHEYESYSGGLVEEEKPDCGFFMITKKQWASLKTQVTTHGAAMEADLTSTMQQPVSEEEDSDYGMFAENTIVKDVTPSNASNTAKGDPNGKYQLYVKCTNCDVTYSIGNTIEEEKNVNGTWTYSFNKPTDIPSCGVMGQHNVENIEKIVVELRKKEGDGFTTIASSSSESMDKIAQVQYMFQ